MDSLLVLKTNPWLPRLIALVEITTVVSNNNKEVSNNNKVAMTTVVLATVVEVEVTKVLKVFLLSLSTIKVREIDFVKY